MKQINYKKLILPNIPYVFFVYLFDKVGQAVRLAPGADISAKILNITQGFSAAFENALPSVYPLDLLVGIVGAVIIRLIVYVKGKNAKKYRKGAEYGSARWGNAEDIKPYIDPDFQNNIIVYVVFMRWKPQKHRRFQPLTFHLPPHVLRLIAPAPAPCFGTGKEYYRRSF